MLKNQKETVFPPKWNLSDSWKVSFNTEAPPSTADQHPSLRETIYCFKVTSLPSKEKPFYRIDIQTEGESDQLALLYREADFSLAKISSMQYGAETQELENGMNPLIYDEKRLAIIPDFPVAAKKAETSYKIPETSAHESIGNNDGGIIETIKLTVPEKEISQKIEKTERGIKITLLQTKNSNILKVVMEWHKGEPWWNTIECRVIPSKGAPFKERLVAKGHLVQ